MTSDMSAEEQAAWDRSVEVRKVIAARSSEEEALIERVCHQGNHVSSVMQIDDWVEEFDDLLPEYFDNTHRRIVAFFLMLVEMWGVNWCTDIAADWLKCITHEGRSSQVQWEGRLGIPAYEVRECIRVVFSLYPDLLEHGFNVESGSQNS